MKNRMRSTTVLLKHVFVRHSAEDSYDDNDGCCYVQFDDIENRRRQSLENMKTFLSNTEVRLPLSDLQLMSIAHTSNVQTARHHEQT